MYLKSFIALLAVATAAQGAPLEARAVVDHDSLSPLPEKVPSGATGTVEKRFEPYLHVASGCQPYPAVDANGNTSGGLQATGSSTGGCSDQSKGQTYTRSTWHNGRYAIMYSWYMPKDQLADGISTGAHRHDWESVVIWIDNPDNESPKILGASASGHGDYKKTSTPQLQGTRPKVEYFAQFPTNHELQFTDTLGKDYPMVDWSSLSQAAVDALENTDFGSADVPFKNANFATNLDKAWV